MTELHRALRIVLEALSEMLVSDELTEQTWARLQRGKEALNTVSPDGMRHLLLTPIPENFDFDRGLGDLNATISAMMGDEQAADHMRLMALIGDKSAAELNGVISALQVVLTAKIRDEKKEA